MKPSEELFISVLKCAFTKQNCDVKVSLDSDEMKEAFHLAEINALPAFFYEGLLYVSEDPTEKLVVTAKLAKITANSAERYDRYKKSIELLAENGVKLITMKGFIARKYYPVPEYRTFGDVDILVKEDTVAKRVLSKAGFKEDHNELHITGMKLDSLYFEIHKSLLDEDSLVPQGAKGLLNNAWHYTRDGFTGGVLEFTEEFHLFYLIVHIAKHFYGRGAGVRMFLDIALMLKAIKEERIAFDLGAFAEYLSCASLSQFAGSVFYLCKRFFGIQLPVIEGISEHIDSLEKDSATTELLAEYVIRGGTFGYSGPAYEIARLRCAYIGNEDKKEAKSKTVKASFFPSRKAMEGRYPFCRNKPFLLPVAHVVRVFNVLINRRRAKSAVIRLKRLCNSEESAQKQVEFYSKIGL